MNRKLTLSVDESVIRQAKTYAARHNETLSGMVERYFKHIAAKSPRRAAALAKTPRQVQALSGIIRLPENLDVKRPYRQARAKKAAHE